MIGGLRRHGRTLPSAPDGFSTGWVGLRPVYTHGPLRGQRRPLRERDVPRATALVALNASQVDA